MKLSTGLCICAAALSAAYITFENEALMLTEYEFKASAELDGFKIVHLSDIHGKRFGSHNLRLINLVSSQEPDIIVISGDLIDSRFPNPDAAYELVGELVKLSPVYYVTGNHEERFDIDFYTEIMTRLRELGVRLLDSRSEIISYNGAQVNVCGMFDRYGFDESEAKELASEGKFNILIRHRPQFAREYAEAGFDLALSGHAHGGQMRLPVIGGVFAPDQYFFPRFSEGLHRFGSKGTVISRGLGSSILPMRVNNRPEVVVVKLVSGKAI